MPSSQQTPGFQLQPIDPERYRRDTRISSLVVLLSFAVIAMAFATLTVRLFDDPEQGSIIWNLLGVLLGLLATVLLVRLVYWKQPWMASARYGWRLKRCLMRISNAIHRLEAAQAAGDPEALRMLRFYHLGVEQMQSLEGGGRLDDDIDPLRERVLAELRARGLPAEQNRFEAHWEQLLKRLPGTD